MPHDPPLKVLVPLDYAGCGTAVAREAATLASALGASAVLLHVIDLPEGVPAESVVEAGGGARVSAEDLVEAEARTALQGLKGIFDLEGVPAYLHYGHGHDVAAVILEHAREIGASHIVLGTHGRTGLRRWVLGSVAEQVIRKAPCPVMTVRAPAGSPDTPSDARRALAAERDG